MYNDLKMNIVQIEIDNGSGFCFGVTTAIKKAEEELAKGGKLYCLGDIVHNGMEVERLHEAGLITIDHEQMEELQGVKVLLRAHGEPPETYALAERNTLKSSMLLVLWCSSCSAASRSSMSTIRRHRL